MKKWIAIEELAQLALAIAGIYFQSVAIPWWLWPLVFLSPDVSMIGYLANPKIGAWCYNLVHHKAVAILLTALGWYIASPILLLIGLVLFGHSCMDRMLGYGLKYEDRFEHTHLGMIGKEKGLSKTSEPS